MNKINLNRPAIILPTIMFIPVLLLGYLLMDLFYTGTDIARLKIPEEKQCIDSLTKGTLDNFIDDMKFKGKNIMTFFSDFANKGALRIVVIDPTEQDTINTIAKGVPFGAKTETKDTSSVIKSDYSIYKQDLSSRINSVLKESRQQAEKDFIIFAVLLTIAYIVYMIVAISYCIDKHRKEQKNSNNISLIDIFGTEGMVQVNEYMHKDFPLKETICDGEQEIMSQCEIIDDEIETFAPVETPEFPDEEYEAEMFRTIIDETPLTIKKQTIFKHVHDIPNNDSNLS